MKLVTFALTLVVTGAGAFLAGRVSDNFAVAMLATAAWFAVAAAIAFGLIRRRSRLAIPAGAAVAVVAVAGGILIGLPTLIGNSVDEEVVVASAGNEQRAAGSFASVAHGGSGQAAVVELPGGRRKLTLTDFETAAGPDLRVYLSTSDPKDGELGDFVDLGALKGNRGDQQYEIPASVDLSRYGVVVIWCRAFSVPFTSAALRTSAEPRRTEMAARPTATAAAARRPRGARVRVISSRFGRVLADGRGFALYLFTRDGRGPSRCYGSCARAWPPLLTRGTPRAIAGADPDLIGTTRRRDGTRQVTYRGKPLYFYVGDRRPGQILCQNVVEFGGTWLVVRPDGRPVR